MSALAIDLTKQGRSVEAEKLAREAVVIEQRMNGPENPSVMNAERILADVLTEEGHYKDAEKLYRKLIRTATKTTDPRSALLLLVCLSLHVGKGRTPRPST